MPSTSHHDACAAHGPKPPVARHILHIVADDLGYRDIGYNNAAFSSPHLDRLRACGVHLDQFYAFKACAPSRASLLTGRYPFRIGVYQNADIDAGGVPSNFTFLPELLRRDGFATHVVGKWHVGWRTPEMTPTWRGFDSFLGYWHCCNDYYTHHFPDAVPNVTTAPTGLLDLASATRDGGPPSAAREFEGVYSSLLFGNVSSRIVRAHDARRRLYLLLSFQAVHGPFQVPDHFVRAAPPGSKQRTLFGMVAAMDAAVGHVIAALRDTKMWSNTLVWFMSDNGATPGRGGNGELRGGKFGLWEGGVRVTAFVGGPAVNDGAAGRSWRGLGHIADVLPTLMSAAGLAPPVADDTGPTPMDGVSLWDAIRSNGSSPRTEVVHQILNQYNARDCYGADHDAQACGAAIRVGRWKLLLGYPGDARPSDVRGGYDKWAEIHLREQRGAAAATAGREALAMARADGCHLLTGEGCACWRGACLYDVEDDAGETRELSRARPEVVARLMRRLAAVSAAGTTEQAALCGRAQQRSDRLAMRSALASARAYLPYDAPSPPWRNDANATPCDGVGESEWWGGFVPPPLPPFDLQAAIRTSRSASRPKQILNTRFGTEVSLPVEVVDF